MRRLLLAAGALALAALLLPPDLRGQEPPPSAEGPGPWEEVVFLPESGLSVLLERDPRGVLLDRASYLDLHRRAREAAGGAEAGAAGPAVRLLRVEAEGAVEGERARVAVRLTLRHRGPGREALPLRLGGSVLSATLDGAPAPLSADPKGGLVLSVEGAGIHEAVVEVAATVEARRGDRTLSLDLPAAPAVRWSLTVPGRVTGRAEGGIGRTERLADPDRTRFVAFGSTGALRASWREGDEGTDLPPLLRGRVRTLAEVGERALDCLVLLHLECWRSPADAFDLDLPSDLAVLGLEGDASLLPAGPPAGGRAPFRIRFPEPFTGARTVLLRATRPLPGPGEAALPGVDLPGAAAVHRLLAVRFTDGLRGRVEAGEGAVRLDPSLSEQGAVDALLRLEAAGAARALSERPSVRLRADARVLLDLADDGPWLAASFLYLPRGDRLYGVDPLLPEGFQPETVAVSGGISFLRGRTPEGRLSLLFPGGVAPGGAVTVTLRGRWPQAGWAEEDAAERAALLPRLDAGTGIEDAEGWLGVAVPAGTEVREEETAGLSAAPVSDLRERAGFSAEGLALGWRFRGGAPGGRLRALRPEPSVTAAAALLATPSEDHLLLEGAIRVEVQRGGIRELRLTVEPPLGELLRIEGPDLAEKRRETAGGRDTWILRLGRRVRDGTRLALRAEIPLAGGRAAVPAVGVEGAKRRDLSVGVAAAGELEVGTEARGLRPADPADLAPALGGRARGLLRAFRGEAEGTPSLAVTVKRLPAVPLPSAFADEVRLATVLGMDSVARTRLLALVRNADLQALEVALPEGALLRSARVAGEAVRPLRPAPGRILVPMVPSAEPVEVMLFYEEPLPAGGGAASLRAPDLGIPGSRATWTVRLPEGSLLAGSSGEFSTPPAPPGTPICVRIAAGIGALLRGGMAAVEKGAPGGSPGGIGHVGARALPAASAPAPVPAAAMDAEAPEDEAAPTTAVPAKPGATADPAAALRLGKRAARRGLFGMDLRLLEAGPAVTATRLGATGDLRVAWRSGARRAAGALLCGILAFATALLARRRGVPAPSWTILALGLFTALPLVLGAADTAPFDGAAAGTLAYGALALLLALGRRLSPRRPAPPAAPARAAGAARATGPALAAALLLLLLPSPAAAKGGGREAPPAGAAPAEPPAAAPAPLPASGETVFVPYDPSRPETLRNPERVFLPYERYLALWNAAHPERVLRPAAAPALLAAAYAGRVEERTLLLEARFEVDAGDGGLLALPPGAAVEDLRVDGSPAPAVAAAPGGAILVPVARPAGRASSVVTATLRWPLAGEAPGGSLQAPLPRAPRCRLLLDLPLADPAIRLAARGGWTSAPAGAGTRVEADLGPLALLDLSWQPRGADAAGGRTRFEAETEAAAVLRPGLLEWSATLSIRVLAGAVAEVESALPEGLVMQSVSGPAVASWTVTPSRVLRIRLLAEGPGTHAISLSALLPAPAGEAPFPVPLPEWRGAAADRLRVSVAAADARVVVAEAAGLERTDAAGGAVPGAQAFRRLRTPARLALRAEARPGEVAAATRLHLHLGAAESLLRAAMDIEPGPAGLFEGVVDLPAGFALEDVSGADPFPLPGAVRLVFRGPPRETRRVVLSLRGPAPGEGPAPFPAVRLREAGRSSADLLVSTAPGFSAAASGAAGLDPVPADAFASWPALEPGEVRRLAFRDGRGGGSLSVAREALRPSLRPTVVADLTVLDDRVIVDALVHHEIRGGPERVFRVDAPPGVEDPWVLGEGLREVRRERAGDRLRLTVTMQAAATGAASFRVLYEIPAGAGGALEAAGPVPLDGEGARAFLLLRALGEAEVRVGAAPGLDPCDLADLPLVPAGLDPLRVLRFLRSREAGWRLPLVLVSHGFGDLPEARIHLLEGTTVADRDGSARTRAAVRIFNRSRSFLPVALPAGAALESVLVGGVPVRPVERPEERGVIQVPVRVQSLGEESQEVVLTFRTAAAAAPGARFERLEPRLPSFPGVSVDATTWRLLLPADRDYSFEGNLDPVEAVEVAIARAEAYGSDVARLREVVRKGSLRQQEVAAENLALNAREMKDSLDLAQSQMDDLAQAAAEGKVDRRRLDEGRRKAAELAKEIEEALGEVRKNVAERQYRGPAGEGGGPAAGGKAEEAARYATKEGQADKKWFRNAAQGEGDRSKSEAGLLQQRFSGGRDSEGRSEQSLAEAGKALQAHEDFDAEVAPDSRTTAAFGGEVNQVVAGVDVPVGGDGTRTFLGLLRAPGDGEGEGGGGAPVPPTGGGLGIVTTRRAGGLGGAAGGVAPRTAEGLYQVDGAGWGGGGGGHPYDGAAWSRGAAVGLLQKAGLVSLAPPLVERGTSFSFRKLDAGAELAVTPRAKGLGARLGAAAGFLLLAALVWLARRRAAARAA